MALTTVQRRTYEHLIRPPDREADPDGGGLADRIRKGIEERLLAAGLRPGPRPIVWLGKHALTDAERCEGRFQARLLREGPPFEHTTQSASGALFHKAIELDIACERGLDPRTVCERAALSLMDSGSSFAAYWDRLDGLGRGELIVDVGRRLQLFRDSFPPLLRAWAPQPELRMRAVLLGGSLVLSGAPDLVLGLPRRLALDFKDGRAWPEHAEDARFYALLLLLRTGVTPYRTATFFLGSGEWQAEDVTEETVGRAAERVVAAAELAVRLSNGRAPMLHAGRHCLGCARRTTCPESISAADSTCPAPAGSRIVTPTYRSVGMS